MNHRKRHGALRRLVTETLGRERVPGVVARHFLPLAEGAEESLISFDRLVAHRVVYQRRNLVAALCWLALLYWARLQGWEWLEAFAYVPLGIHAFTAGGATSLGWFRAD